MRSTYSSSKGLARILCALALVVFIACKKDKKDDETPKPDVFPKENMLANISDNLILPGYISLRISLDSLINAYDRTADVSKLNALRAAYKAAYMQYQVIEVYGFGPGEDEALRVNCNIFPTDTSVIRNNIASGSADLSTASNSKAKGFPALDFLFLGYKRSDAGVISDITDTKTSNYIHALLNDLRTHINKVCLNWANYRGTFINSLGADIGSSTGFMVNQMSFELELTRNARIANPLGLRSGGAPLPNTAEAYYSGNSLAYAKKSVQGVESLYRGLSPTGSDGTGFDDYLNHLGVKHGSNSLDADIKTQFAAVYAKFDAVQDPLSEKVLSNPGDVEAIYRELQKLVVLLKTDLPSSIGVVITYQDGDGD